MPAGPSSRRACGGVRQPKDLPAGDVALSCGQVPLGAGIGVHDVVVVRASFDADDRSVHDAVPEHDEPLLQAAGETFGRGSVGSGRAAAPLGGSSLILSLSRSKRAGRAGMSTACPTAR